MFRFGGVRRHGLLRLSRRSRVLRDAVNCCIMSPEIRIIQDTRRDPDSDSQSMSPVWSSWREAMISRSMPEKTTLQIFLFPVCQAWHHFPGERRENFRRYPSLGNNRRSKQENPGLDSEAVSGSGGLRGQAFGSRQSSIPYRSVRIGFISDARWGAPD